MLINHKSSLLAYAFTSSLILSGCGGGGGGETEATTDEPTQNTPVTATSIEVTAIDGYIRGAIAYVDINGNGVKDNDEPSAITGEGGRGLIDTTSLNIDLENAVIVVDVPVGAVDESTITTSNPNGLPITEDNTYQLISLPGETIVTPLTTLISITANADSEVNGGDIQTVILTLAENLGLTESELISDYIASDNEVLAKVAALMVENKVIPSVVTEKVSLAELFIANQATTKIAEVIVKDISDDELVQAISEALTVSIKTFVEERELELTDESTENFNTAIDVITDASTKAFDELIVTTEDVTLEQIQTALAHSTVTSTVVGDLLAKELASQSPISEDTLKVALKTIEILEKFIAGQIAENTNNDEQNNLSLDEISQIAVISGKSEFENVEQLLAKGLSEQELAQQLVELSDKVKASNDQLAETVKESNDPDILGDSDGDGVVNGADDFPNDAESWITLGHINFTNSELASCLLNQYSENTANNKITEVTCKEAGITNLSGLEQLNAIVNLDLSDNEITDISSLTHFSYLKSLTISAQYVDDLSVLNNISSLVEAYDEKGSSLFYDAVFSGDLFATILNQDALTTGTVVVEDANVGQDSFNASSTTGSYGLFSIGVDGAWTYTLDIENVEVTNLVYDTDKLTDSFSVSSFDGTTTSVTLTVTGAIFSLTKISQVAEITDTSTSSSGYLRMKLAEVDDQNDPLEVIEAGRISLLFSKDEVVFEGNMKEAYITLFGGSTSTYDAMFDLRIGNGTYKVRPSNRSEELIDLDVPTTFTPGDWVKVDLVWDASNATDTVGPDITLYLDGIEVYSAKSVSPNKADFKAGVRTVNFKLSDTSSTPTGAFRIEDFKVYSDKVGENIVFEDNFDGYILDPEPGYDINDVLSKENGGWNNITSQAKVIEALVPGE